MGILLREPTDICSIDKAEKVEKSDGRNNIKINLHQKFGLCLGIELNNWTTIPLIAVSKSSIGEKDCNLLVRRQMTTLCCRAESFHVIVVVGWICLLFGRSISRVLGRSTHSLFLNIVISHLALVRRKLERKVI